MLKSIVAVLIIFAVGVSAHGADGAGFSFKTGIGYDFLSQRYFLDSLRYVGGDSVLTKFALTNDYLNDFKGSLDFHYLYDDVRRVDLRASYEQTPDLFRIRMSSEWGEETFIGNFRWRNEVDWRDQYHQTDRAIGSYVYGLSQAKLKYPITVSTKLWGQGQVDGVKFYDQRVYGYDYYRYGGKFGLEKSFGLFTTMSLNAFMMNRQVRDSVSLDYRSFGVETSFLGSFGRDDLDFLARWEHKNYLRPDNDEDYSRLDFDAQNRISIGENFVSRQEVQLESAWFDPLDALNLDYQRIGGTVLGGPTYGSLEIGIGPDFEVLIEQSEDTTIQQDYYEMGGKLEATYFTGKGLFGSIDSELGYRHLSYQNEIQSNFVYYRLNLIADWTLFKAISFNTLLSTEWDWHDKAGADTRVVLLSTNLSYAF